MRLTLLKELLMNEAQCFTVSCRVSVINICVFQGLCGLLFPSNFTFYLTENILIQSFCFTNSLFSCSNKCTSQSFLCRRHVSTSPRTSHYISARSRRRFLLFIVHVSDKTAAIQTRAHVYGVVLAAQLRQA